MKRILWSLLLILILCSFTACSGSVLKYSITGKKVSSFFYTDTMAKQIKSEGISSIVALQTNLQKEIILKDEDIDTFNSFFSGLKTKNFLSDVPNIPQNPEFKFYITSGSEKFVINVYNEKYISIFPWDGSFSMDYIDMSGIKPLYNLYNLCKYLYRN